MRILTDPKAYSPRAGRPLILGLGNFDGLHLGHQKLLGHVVTQARTQRGAAAVMTFQSHPHHVLHPKEVPELLMSAEHRQLYLEEVGIDLCFWLPFTTEFSKIRAVAFVEELLVRRLQVREVCMGYNAHFGYGREGDCALVRYMAERFKFKFEEVEPVKAAGDFVSSSRIRKLVREGKLDETAECLGRPFSVLARIGKGRGVGTKLGYPTANLELASDILPPVGIYPVMVRTLDYTYETLAGETDRSLKIRSKGPWLQGVMSYGYRPTFEKEGLSSDHPVPEIYILDFEGDLYGKTLECAFYPRLRPEMKFDNAETLKTQIRKDVDLTRRYFGGLPKKSFTNVA